MKKAKSPIIRATDPLIADIHALNREAKLVRDDYERELIYRDKNRLQNDLLRQFGEHFEALRDPERPGTLSLTRRCDGRDACHVKVSALDADVRSMIGL